MLKSLTAFALLLLGIGTGLSLYLPKYPPEVVKQANFSILTDTLDKPVDASSLLSSSQIFGTSDTSDQYGLQLGLFGSLFDAKNGANQWEGTSLPTSPIIFKAGDGKHQWYIVSTGPLNSREASQKHQQLLQDSGYITQIILWPVAADGQ